MKTLRRGQLIGVGLLAFFLVFMVMPLNKAGAYPCSVFEEAGVTSWHKPDDSIGTIFYAYISGPSPEDVTSFTVTGPSGPFNMLPIISSRERGLIYIHVENSVVIDGSYTFEITDSLARTASLVKNFTYNDTLPRVDSSFMMPQNETYVGTTTPTLSFNSVPGNIYYKIYLSDYYGNAFWYMSPVIQATSFQVPAGLLQPDTAYSWYVRVFDDDTDPQNCHQSETLTFYTGTKALPNLDTRYASSMERPGVAVNWFGVASTNIAPWDISYLEVTSPDSSPIVYSLDDMIFRFCSPAYYSIVSNSPFPMTDGIYTFEIEDDDAHYTTETLNYTYDPLPFVDEASMTPIDNAYVDTDTLDFSWNPLAGTGTYYYRVRIWDYNEKVIWYDTYPTTGITSIAIPVSGNFERGSSYKWQLMVYDSDTQAANNWTNSSRRTFTINPDKADIYGDELAGDFGANGLWHYDDTKWSKKTGWDADDDLTHWSGGLAVDFGANGLWTYDGTVWSKKTGWDVGSAGMVGWACGLTVDFDGNGLWNYDGTKWRQKTNWDPDDDLTHWSGGLAVDFGANGLWNYDGITWSKKTGWDAGSGGMAGWSGGLAVDFDGSGLWNYDGSTWSKKTSWDAGDGGLCGWYGGLAVDFDANGLWNYDGSTWSKKTSLDPEGISALGSGFAADFGANGVWYYDGTIWSKKTNWNAENLTDVDLY